MNTLPHPTRNSVSKKGRAHSVALLNQALANLTDLHSQTLQAHWNVRGQHFYQLHKLFEKLADDVEEPLDGIAERVMALGGVALGTVRLAAKASQLPEYPLAGVEDLGHVKALAERYGFCASSIRASINSADEAGDKDTADLFTAVSRTLDQALWFLEAHGQ
jgi:starvation-inducible DNA-binding protein